MHWSDRGPEPDGLEQIRQQLAPQWVQYYRHGVGGLPRDTRWRDFKDALRDAFFGLCAYCESRARGEVDHFRPKSREPELVYSWSNWLFACHDCNHAKGDKWPAGGYVDPCARSKPARPEHFFSFDTWTGEVLPKADLSIRRRQKAQRTIDSLRLNEWHHLKNRLEWLRMVSVIFPEDSHNLTSDTEQYRVHLEPILKMGETRMSSEWGRWQRSD